MDISGIDKEVKYKIIGVLRVLFPEAKIYLYGSRARGDFKDVSDIDLAIDNGIGKPRLKLGEARSLLYGLRAPYKIDLVDLNYVPEKMHQIILKEGILWSV